MLLNNLFLNPTGAYALLALIPFLILYIVRPKPKKVIIPSLMFFIKDKNKSNFNSFLQKFINDFLFLIQFIILLLLCLSIARPYANVPTISYSDSVVFVIDASASMSAKEDGKTRFEKALDIVGSKIENRNTIILATNKAEIVVENAGATATRAELFNLKSRQIRTQNIYDSIIASEKFAKTENSAVFFISDFANDIIEEEFIRAKIFLESKGINVFFEDVSKDKAQNVGIIDIDIKELELKIWIKNFKNQSENFELVYGDKKQDVFIEANDIAVFTLTTIPGKSKIELKVKDDFQADNIAYVSTPEKGSINVLLITNDNEKFLKTALGLMDKINLNIQNPPVVNIDNPDLIILGNINKNVFIPGNLNKIKDLVKSGTPVIIMGQDNLLDIKMDKDFFPFELIKRDPVNIDDFIVSVQENSYITPSEMHFGMSRKAYEIEQIDTSTNNKKNIVIYAESSKNKYPIITMHNLGRGKILYYGLFDEYSDFKADIYYPVFWKRVIDTLIDEKTIGELNRATGNIQTISENTIAKTPYGNKNGPIISLDYVGFYDFPTHSVSANIFSEEEQRLNKNTLNVESSRLIFEAEKMRNSTTDKELTYLFATISIFLLIIELLYVKLRGDI
jgi:hypothetical protein